MHKNSLLFLLSVSAFSAPSAALTTLVMTPYTAPAPSGVVSICGDSDPVCRSSWVVQPGGVFIVATGTNLPLFERPPLGVPETEEYLTMGQTQASLDLSGKGRIFGVSWLWGSIGGNQSFTVNAEGSSPFVITGGNVLSLLPPGIIDGWTTVLFSAPTVVNSLVQTNTARPGFRTESARFAMLPVPETASWAMMIAGFGLVGAMMRRRLAGNSGVKSVTA